MLATRIDPRHNFRRVTLAIACLVAVLVYGGVIEFILAQRSYRTAASMMWHVITTQDASGSLIGYDLFVAKHVVCLDEFRPPPRGYIVAAPTSIIVVKTTTQRIQSNDLITCDLIYKLPIPFTEPPPLK